MIVGLVRAATSPLLVVGHEIQRYGLADRVAALGVTSALSVRTAAALGSALAAAKATDAPVLIVARVDPHDLPAELA